MLRYIWMAVMIILSLFSTHASAADTANAFRYPLDTYKITQWYNNDVNHDGIDFGVACGTPIYAVADGEIVSSGVYGEDIDKDGVSDTSWGELTRIRHVLPDGNVVYSQYAHQKTRTVTAGDVTYGQKIGEVGTSGKSSGCHLHLQIITEDKQGCGYYPGNCAGIWPTEAEYWETFLDPITFLEDHLGEDDQTCEDVEYTVYGDPVDMVFFNAIPDGTDYDISMYYKESDTLNLLNRGDMDSAYTNPVIDNAEPNPENKQRWLAGDVNSDGWDDAIMIAHNNGDMKAQVWLSYADGTFEEHDTWLTSSTQYDEYLLTPSGDLIAGEDTGSGIDWYKCESNGTSFDSCTYWEQMGGDLDDDVFLTGDFTGNGNPNLLRGYIADDQDETCGVSGHSHKKLRWRLLKSGGNKETWEQDWGCPNADYVVGNVDNDAYADHGTDDLIQIRHDDADTGKVFVLLSEGDDFSASSTWKSDFGSSSHKYWASDIDRDGCTDLIDYKDDGNDKINVAYSDCVDGFGSNVTLITGVDKETGGAFRFGNFGELALAVGSETEWVCTSDDEFSSASAETSSVLNSNGYCLPTEEYAVMMIFEPDAGLWHWMISDGAAFDGSHSSEATQWYANSNGSDCYDTFYQDVDGDDLPDLIYYEDVDGAWYVQLGNGTTNGFTDDGSWITGHGESTDCSQYQGFLGDVDGDGLVDAITYETAIGEWYVAYNTGTSFDSAVDLVLQSWGNQTYDRFTIFVEDVTGDGVVEFVAHEHSLGKWHAAENDDPGVQGTTYSGLTYLLEENWCKQTYSNQYVCELTDLNGDGAAEPVAYEPVDGDHHKAISNGVTFDSSTSYLVGDWLFGTSGQYVSYYIDVTFDGNIDVVVWEPDTGYWYVADGNGDGTANSSSTVWVQPAAVVTYEDEYIPVPLK